MPGRPRAGSRTGVRRVADDAAAATGPGTCKDAAGRSAARDALRSCVIMWTSGPGGVVAERIGSGVDINVHIFGMPTEIRLRRAAALACA
jgi:hypothetical protein